MRTRNKLIVVICMALLVALTAIAFNLLVETNRNSGIYSSGHGSTTNTTITIDYTLTKYINVTITGQAGVWQKETRNITIDWIGAPQDPVKSLRSVHLIAYTKLDKNATWSQNTYMLYNGFYITATPNGTAIPADALDHREIIVPEISAEVPNYPLSFTLSVYN